MEEQISRLKKEICSLHKRPTTTVNIDNRTQIQAENLVYVNTVSQKHLEEHAVSLTLGHVNNGAVGYAQYAIEYPLKGSIHCQDFSRKKLMYKQEDGNIVTDYAGRKLTRKFFESLREKTDRKAKEKMFEIMMWEGEDDEIVEARRAQIDRLRQITSDVRAAARGDKTMFTQEWVTELCSLVRI